MTDSHMQDAAMKFLCAIKQSREYREYEMQLAKIKMQPELFVKVNEFRQKNFVLQNTAGEDELLDCMDKLESEYDTLREIPLVEDFLEAETAFCRMIQEVNMFITRELDFE